MNYQKIIDGSETVQQDCFLFTYTDMLGQVPEHVKKFVLNNRAQIKGVIGSGNKNFGQNFCKAAKTISDKLNIKLIMEFELAGNMNQINQLREIFVAAGGF